jgi:hypothetical protein
MLRRCKPPDWKELLFGLCFCVGVCYLFLFGYAWSDYLRLMVALVAALVSLVAVVLMTVFRLDSHDRTQVFSLSLRNGQI